MTKYFNIYYAYFQIFTSFVMYYAFFMTFFGESNYSGAKKIYQQIIFK